MKLNEQRNPLHEQLDKLVVTGKLPTFKMEMDSLLYRVQQTSDSDGNPYKNGFYFGAPNRDLGRYNDPNQKLKVCYVADNATTALAEVFCRGGSDKFLEQRDLEIKSVATLATLKPLILLDIGRLLPLIDKPLDTLTSKSYDLTQEIVKFFSEGGGYSVDGIAYTSRHYNNRQYCYALWSEEEVPNMLDTKSIEMISKFTTTSEVPDDWNETDIDGEEILTEVLGFKVSTN